MHSLVTIYIPARKKEWRKTPAHLVRLGIGNFWLRVLLDPKLNGPVVTVGPILVLLSVVWALFRPIHVADRAVWQAFFLFVNVHFRVQLLSLFIDSMRKSDFWALLLLGSSFLKINTAMRGSSDCNHEPGTVPHVLCDCAMCSTSNTVPASGRKFNRLRLLAKKVITNSSNNIFKIRKLRT